MFQKKHTAVRSHLFFFLRRERSARAKLRYSAQDLQHPSHSKKHKSILQRLPQSLFQFFPIVSTMKFFIISDVNFPCYRNLSVYF